MNQYPIFLMALVSGSLGLVIALTCLVISIVKTAKAESGGGGVKLNRKRSTYEVLSAFVMLSILTLALSYVLNDHGEPWAIRGLMLGAVAGTVVGVFALLTLQHQNQAFQESYETLDHFINSLLRSGQSVGVMAASTGLVLTAGSIWLSRRFPDDIYDDSVLNIALGASLASLVFHILGNRLEGAANTSRNGSSDTIHSTASVASIQFDSITVSTDVFAIYTCALSAASWLIGNDSPWSDLPLLFASITLLTSILSGWILSFGRKKRLIGGLFGGIFLNLLIALGSAFFVLDWFLPQIDAAPLLSKPTLLSSYGLGLLLIMLLSILSEYYSARTFLPAKVVAKASEEGFAKTIIAGLSLGFKSSLVLIVAAAGILIAVYYLGSSSDVGNADMGVFSIVIALTGMVSLFANIGGLYAFGASTRRAGMIVGTIRFGGDEELPGYLDNIGRTIQSVSRGVIVITGTVTGGLLLVKYALSLGSSGANVSLSSPLTYAFLLIGGFLPCWFSGTLMDANFQRGGASKSNDHINANGTASNSATFLNLLIDLPVPLFRTIILVAFPLLVLGVVAQFWSLQAQVLVLIGDFLISMLLASSVLIGAGVWNSARRRIEMGYSGGVYSGAYTASTAGDDFGSSLQNAFAPTLLSLVIFLLLAAILMTPAVITL